MKVFVLAPRENWICDRIAEEWIRNNPEVNTNDPLEADLIWLLAGWCWNHLHPKILASKKVLVTVHHIVPEKFNEQSKRDFLARDQFVDCYHTPNHKTAEILRQFTDKPIFSVCYWYDAKQWFPEDKISCRKELNIPEDKFIVGSFQRDTEGGTTNPKLEKGPDLLCEFLKKLQSEKDIHVLLGGWRREYVIGRLESENIEYDFFERASLNKLRKMYNACDLYVVSSRYEGGPQAILEAACMNVPIISRDVGIARDVLSPYCLLDIPDQVCIPKQEWTDYNFEKVKLYEISSHKNSYLEMFKRIIK